MSVVFPSSNNLLHPLPSPARRHPLDGDGPMRKTFRDCARSSEYICMLHFSRVFIRRRKFAVPEPRLAVVARHSLGSVNSLRDTLRPLYATFFWDILLSNRPTWKTSKSYIYYINGSIKISFREHDEMTRGTCFYTFLIIFSVLFLYFS